MVSHKLGLYARFILLSGFPKPVGIPGLLDAIGLDAAEELDDIRWEEIIITAGRVLDTTLSSSSRPWILFAVVMQLIKLKIFGAATRAEMADIEQMKKIVPHHAWKLPLVRSSIWCLESV